MAKFTLIMSDNDVFLIILFYLILVRCCVIACYSPVIRLAL